MATLFLGGVGGSGLAGYGNVFSAHKNAYVPGAGGEGVPGVMHGRGG